MENTKYVFGQLMDFLPKRSFDMIVKKYDADKRVCSFSCYNLLLVMIFGHLSNRESLTDLAIFIKAHASKSYHLGFGKTVTKSNLSKTNARRDYRVFKDFSFQMMERAQRLLSNSVADPDKQIYAIDSSTIDLCLNIFWWANFRSTKAGVKVHSLLDVQTNIPAFIHISAAKVHDINFLSMLNFEPGSYYIMDRAYLAFKKLNQINHSGAFFVLRAKENTRFERLSSNNKKGQPGVKFDQVGRFGSKVGRQSYPEKVRLIKYYDKELNRTFRFLTNNFNISALEVANLYKQRWTIELFFKWIKSHLKVKKFWGHSENALKIQIYSAISAYCLMAIVKHNLKHEGSIYEMLQVFGPSLLDKTPVNQLLNNIINNNHDILPGNSLQTSLF